MNLCVGVKANGAAAVRGRHHRLTINGYVAMIKLTNSELHKVNDTFYSFVWNGSAQLKCMFSFREWYFFPFFLFTAPSFADGQMYLDETGNYRAQVEVIKMYEKLWLCSDVQTADKHHLPPRPSAHLSVSSSSRSISSSGFTRDSLWC